MIRFDKTDNSIFLTKGDSAEIVISLNTTLSQGDAFVFSVTSLLDLNNDKIIINSTDSKTEEGYYSVVEKDNKSIITIFLTSAATANLNRGKYAYHFTITSEDGKVNTFHGGDINKCLFYIT